MNYPKNFTVKGDEYTWHVKQIKEDSWNWSEVNVGSIGSYSSKDMDDMNRKEMAFLFPEPDLVFPFTYRHVDGDFGGTVKKLANTDIVFEMDNERPLVNYWSEGEIKNLIQKGLWIITSVGEQKPVEAPTSPLIKSDVHTIQIDIKPVTEATEALNKLAEAAKAAQVAMDNLKLSFD